MRTHHSAGFKAKIVQEMPREEKTMTQIAAEHGLHPNQLTRWKALALHGLPSLSDQHDTTANLRLRFPPSCVLAKWSTIVAVQSHPAAGRTDHL